MRSTKRILAVILALSICLSLCGCGAQTQNNKEMKGDPALSAPPYYLDLKAAEGKTWQEFFASIGMKDQMIVEPEGADEDDIKPYSVIFPEKISYLGYEFKCKIKIYNRRENRGEMTLVEYVMDCEFDNPEDFLKETEKYLRVYYDLEEKLTAIFGNSNSPYNKSLGDTFEDALFRFNLGNMSASRIWEPASKDDFSLTVGINSQKRSHSFIDYISVGISFDLPLNIENLIDRLNETSKR